MSKITKTDRIRKLLSQDVAVKDIAKRLGVKPSLVYVVRWQDKNKKEMAKKKAQYKSKRSRLIQAVFQTAKEVEDAERSVFTPDSVAKKDFVEVTYPLPDPVNHPPHYKTGGIETIDFIEAKDLNYRMGNAVKYVSRAGKKEGSDPIEDLEKAVWYLQREIAARRKA
jgi:hypothetical protein